MNRIILLLCLLCSTSSLYAGDLHDWLGKDDPIVAPKPVKLQSWTDSQTKPAVAHSTAKKAISGTHWNIEGDWNASDAEIARHIRQVHGIDPTGMTREQMLAVHDADHNKRVTVRYSAPSSSCPGGICPTTPRSRWRFR